MSNLIKETYIWFVINAYPASAARLVLIRWILAAD